MRALELDLDEKSLYSNLSKDQVNKHTVSFVLTNNQQFTQQKTENAIHLVRKINEIPNINTCFRSINQILEKDGIVEGSFVDSNARRKRFQYPKSLFYSFSQITGFLFKRFAVKTRFFGLLNFQFSHNKNKKLSKAEVLGRLIYCGFEIEHVTDNNGVVTFVARKKSAPMPKQKISGGLVFAMPRVGKNGKIIFVYKLRTMYPYSEFVQTYLKNKHGYDHTGKIKDDFRVTNWGKFLRKYWLDELPQLINLLKGELKLVGFRPVSKAYFNELPDEMKQLRLNKKPGCIPPYLALNRKSSVESVLEAEKDYLQFCSKYRLADFCFFFSAIYHIVITGKRSV